MDKEKGGIQIKSSISGIQFKKTKVLIRKRIIQVQSFSIQSL